MSHFVSRAAGALVLALAAATAAQAAPVTVKVADLNTLSPTGAQAFDARVETAAGKFCARVRAAGGRLAGYNDCVAGVRLEMAEKFQARNAELAKRANGTTLAAAN